jgi:hypothetical protein
MEMQKDMRTISTYVFGVTLYALLGFILGMALGQAVSL